MTLFGRRWRLVALGLAVMAGAIVAVLHTPMAERWLLKMATQTVDRGGLRLGAERLTLNLFSLEADVSGVTLASRETPDQPFLTIEHAHIDLPWSALWSELSVEEVALVRPRLTVSGTEDGKSNLPTGPDTEETASATATPLSIGALDVAELTVDWRDAAIPMHLEIGPVTTTLAPTGRAIAGPLQLDGLATIEVADQRLDIEEMIGRLSFDGTSLELDQLRLRGPDGTLVADGEIGDILNTPRLDLTIVGDIDLEPLATRVSSDASGRVAIDAELSGPPTELSVAVAMVTETAQWDTVSVSDVEGRFRLTPPVATIERLTARIAGGTVAARGSVTLATGGGALQLEWNRLSAQRLLTMLAAQSPLPTDPSMTLDGTLDASWTESGFEDATLDVLSRVQQVGRTGETRLVGREGQWRIDLDVPFADAARAAGTTTVHLGGDSWRDWMLAGDLNVSCDALRECQRAVALETLERPPAGRLALDLALDGTLGDPRADASLRLNATDTLGLPPAVVTAEARLTTTTMELSAAEARLADNTLRAQGRLTWASGELDAQVDAVLADLEAFAPLLPGTRPPAGTVQVTAAVGGTLSAPVIEISAAEARLADNTLRAQGRLIWASGELEAQIDAVLADLEAFAPLLPGTRLPAGTIQMTAAVAGTLSAPVAEQFSVTGHEIALRAAAPDTLPLDGTLDFDLSGRGGWDDLHASGQLRFTELSVEKYRIGRVDSELTIDGHVIRALVTAGELGSVADVTLDLADGPQASATVQVTDADLGRLGTSGAPLTGRASANLTIAHSFDNPDSTDLELVLHRIAGSLADTSITLEQMSRMRYDASGLSVDRLDLALGASRLTLEGGLSRDGRDRLAGNFRGPATDLTPLLELMQEADDGSSNPELSGAMSLDFVLSGSMSTPQISGELHVDRGGIAIPEQPPVENLELRASLRDRVLHLDHLAAGWQDMSLRATGILPIAIFGDTLPEVLIRGDSVGNEAAFHLEADGVTPALLAPYVDPATLEQLDGTLGVLVDLTATELQLESVRGSIRFPVGQLTASGVQLAQRRETRIELEDGRLRVAAFDWGSEQDYLTVGGSVTLEDTPKLDLSVTGEMDMRIASGLFPGGATAGQALLIANIQGPFDDPALTGVVELADAAIRIPDPRLAVSDLYGAILLNRETFVIHEMKGEANGGTVVVGGTLTLDGFRPEGTLTLTGAQMAMDVPTGLRTEVDAELSVTLGAEDIVLSGTATVLRGAYREPMTLAGGVLGFLEQSRAVPIVALDEPGPLDDIRLDLRVTTADDIRLDNNYLNAALGANINLGGTIGTPAVTGRVAVREGGRVRFGAREYEIETATIDLVDPAGIEPSLDVRARTRASTYDVTLSVSGSPGDFRTTLESDPPLPESDVVSVLVTGRTLAESGEEARQGAQNQALGLVSTELLASAGGDLGLEVRVGEESGPGGRILFDSSLVANDLDPTTRLTVGRQLSEQITLIASQNLRDSELAWIVDYFPRDNIEIRGLFSGDNERAYEFRHALEMGHPPPRTETLGDRPSATTLRRVDRVMFTGSTGFLIDELQDVIRLRAGDRFDFFRWQDDQDRLEQFYRSRGYREVRLRARRTESPSSVSLEYDIVQGPSTAFVIDGYDAPSSLRRAVGEAWERSVLDAFLLDEVRALAREHLDRRGFLQATVEAIMDASQNPPQKTLTVSVGTGPRTTEREVVFHGNDAIDDTTLGTFAAERGLDSAAWSNPRELENALLGLYRSFGWLEASVVIEPPVFEDLTAQLPVQIEEGRLFVIGAVQLSGVVARSEQEVFDGLGLTAGAPYRPTEVQIGRSVLERWYRASGFNAARVTIQSTLDADEGTVALEVVVREGLQQIVEDVVVEGRARSHPTLVTNALRISPGELVDLSEWNRARRRLYDTGVFRTVDIQAVPIESDASGKFEAVRARIVLEELPVYGLRYGLAVTDREPLATDASRDFGLAFATDFNRRNLLGRGVTTGVSARASTRQNALRGYVGTNQFFGLPLATSVFAENRRETLGEEGAEFFKRSRSLSFEQRIRQARRVSYAYSANFERNHTFEKDPDPIFPFDVTVNIVRFNGSVLIDSRDNLFDSSTGWFHSSTAEYGFEPGDSSLKFAKYFTQQYHYWPVGPFVLASAGRVGLGSGLGGEVIPSERFFAGGSNTVRGYAQDSLGPSDFLGALGGNAMVVLNQEVRFPLVWRLRGVGFLDAGNVFETVQQISLTELAVGTGIGVRVDTPVGLLRFDYGFPMRWTEDEPTGRFYFSIGQAF